jgi:hypothetical protein
LEVGAYRQRNDSGVLLIPTISTGLTPQIGTVSGTVEVGKVIVLSGTMSLGGTLNVTCSTIPPVGYSLDVVNNVGNAAISGNFTNLPDGAMFTVKHGNTAMTFQISYVGADSVIIKRISLADRGMEPPAWEPSPWPELVSRMR